VAKSRLEKKHVFGGAGTVAGTGRQTLACALEIMVIRAAAITPNGTAVEGVCVTWRNPPVDCPGCEQGKSPGGPPGMAQYLPSRCARALSRSRYKEMVYR
jgi:hypothetical protein